MSFDPVTAALDFGGKLIDKFFTSPEEKAKARLKLIELNQAGELKELETRMSAILAEAKSSDPWTSRARPSFLYVVYVMILSSIPIGILTVFHPAAASQIASGMRGWLDSIPSDMWEVFKWGYCGYAVARSYDKKKS